MARQIHEKASASDFEVDSQDLHLQSKVRSLRLVDTARISLTALALLMGLTVLGVSADALHVYNETHLGREFRLPLWPDEFNLRPTVALVAGAAVVVVCNAVSLVGSKVQSLRSRTAIHTPLTFAAPFVGLVAALAAMALFYAVHASDEVDTLLSWTCRWRAVPMLERPHFGQLCRESWAGVYLAVLLVPVEAGALAAAAWVMRVERYTSAYVGARRTPSPAMA